MPLHIEPIPAFKDNYFWLISSSTSRSAWIVDPGDAAPVLERLRVKQLHLEGVLLTHHHPDHDAGIPTLRQHYPKLRVVGGTLSKPSFTTEQLADNDGLTILDHHIQVMDVPGHTLDHIAFYCAEQALLFSGDTLFAGGCGRLFDGRIEQLYSSLLRIARLPGDTLNYCAHEYTLNNLAFALIQDPDNARLKQRLLDTRLLRDKDLPSIPSLLSLELATNPFLRCHEPSIMTAVHGGDRGHILATPFEVFRALRALKDRF
jgi:hydroxyacylglutathione hydrolase